MAPTLHAVRSAVARPASFPDAEKRAAVAAILTPGLELLFILRAEFAGDPWSGHVAFPGGRVDPGDKDPLAAAIRETREEIGLDLREVEYLGALEPMGPLSGVSTLVIHPYVFALDREPELVLNREVRSIHRISLERLLANEGRGRMDWTWKGQPVELPCVDFDGVRLWGLTLRFVDDLLDRLRRL